MLLSEAIQALLLATRADGRSRRTVASYKEKLAHLLSFLGDVDVESITVDDLRRYIAFQMSEHVLFAGDPRQRVGTLSPFTVATRVRAIKRLFNFLEAEGRITANPTSRLKTLRPKRREPKGITSADVRALLATASGSDLADVRDRAIILFLYDTGGRVGGLCGLRVDDVYMEAGLAVVSEKGGKTRYVMFTSRTTEALAAWLAVRPTDRGDGVFVSLRHKRTLSPNGVWEMLRRRARQAGIEGAVNPHAFRHAFAREFLLDGGDLGTLSDILGHASVETTKSFYGIFTIQELQARHRQHSPVARMFEEENRNGD